MIMRISQRRGRADLAVHVGEVVAHIGINFFTQKLNTVSRRRGLTYALYLVKFACPRLILATCRPTSLPSIGDGGPPYF